MHRHPIRAAVLAAALASTSGLGIAQVAPLQGNAPDSTAAAALDPTRPQPGRIENAAQPATVVVLLPAQQANNQLGNGCWVRFFDGDNFRGQSITLVGPVAMAKMDVPGPFWRDWDSAQTGPRARVTTFDNENFRDRTATLQPGRQIADLGDAKLGWFDEIKSARVDCQG